MQSRLYDRLLPYGIIVESTAITNFNFSADFEQAIEAKVTANQQMLKAETDLKRIKIEAEQKVTTAKAEAEALAAQKQQVTPELLQLRAIEKWDGHMPQVAGGAMPFIDVSCLKAA